MGSKKKRSDKIKYCTDWAIIKFYNSLEKKGQRSIKLFMAYFTLVIFLGILVGKVK